jgi:SAM-dependent methyltransferase
LGLQDIARVVEHDVTVDTVFAALPKVGTVDVITMSYSFSMIPNKKAAMTNAGKLLKKGGYVCIADFIDLSRLRSTVCPFDFRY